MSVYLRPATVEDYGFLGRLRNNFELQYQLLSHPAPHNDDQVAEWIKRRSHDPTGMFFVIDMGEVSTTPLGYCQLYNIDHISGTAEIGLCINPDDHGNGYGKEALEELMEYTRRALNLRKLWVRVLAENEKAIHLYSKADFHPAGVLKHHFWANGKYHDMVIMEAFFI